MQSVLTPSTSFLFFKPSTPCPHSFVVGYWFLECSFSGVIRAGCRSLQGVFCGCVSSKWVNVIFGAGWLELGMATYTEDISSVLWLCLTPLCDNFSSLQLFLSYLLFYGSDAFMLQCPVPATLSIAAPRASSFSWRVAAKDELLCLGWQVCSEKGQNRCMCLTSGPEGNFYRQ